MIDLISAVPFNNEVRDAGQIGAVGIYHIDVTLLRIGYPPI